MQANTDLRVRRVSKTANERQSGGRGKCGQLENIFGGYRMNKLKVKLSNNDVAHSFQQAESFFDSRAVPSIPIQQQSTRVRDCQDGECTNYTREVVLYDRRKAG